MVASRDRGSRRALRRGGKAVELSLSLLLGAQHPGVWDPTLIGCVIAVTRVKSKNADVLLFIVALDRVDALESELRLVGLRAGMGRRGQCRMGRCRIGKRTIEASSCWDDGE